MKTSNPIRDIPGYLKFFTSFTGRRIYFVFVLAVLAALAEGFGIVMVVPLLSNIDGSEGLGDGTQGRFASFIEFIPKALGIDSAAGILILIGIAFVAKGLVSFCAQTYSFNIQAQLMREIRLSLFNAYCRMDYLYYTRSNTGHMINILNAQVHTAYQAFYFFFNLFTVGVVSLAYFALAFMLSWSFGGMAIVIGIVMFTMFRRVNIYVRQLSRNTASEDGRLSSLLVQALHGFKYLSATGQISHLNDSVMMSIKKIMTYQVKQGIATAFTNTIREPLAVFFIVLIIIVQIQFLGAPLAPILVSILLFYRGLNSILSFQAGWQHVLTFIGAVELVRDELGTLNKHKEVDGTIEISSFRMGIELQNLFFSYDHENDNVLENVSLRIPANTTVGIVGDSGAGKSTLIDLLSLLLKPRQGQVLIDGIPGTKIKLDSWRRQIGYVSQDSVIFDDSLANNICLWEGDIDGDAKLFERVKHAANMAYIAEYIESLPGGFHSQVGDRGVRLSGGQKQRLFIARELFKNPKLLILDEATSSLDSESENFIQQSIDALRGKITVVIIAHRLSTIRNVDEVFVFEKGRLIEHGPYHDLISKENSKFAAMVSLQKL